MTLLLTLLVIALTSGMALVVAAIAGGSAQDAPIRGDLPSTINSENLSVLAARLNR
jgi:hypothetical protein